MSDKDQNDPAKKDGQEFEGDLNNLSSDEKAAFEKIMSQIESVESSPVPDNASDQGVEGVSSEAPEDSRSEPDAGGDTEDLTEDEQAALDKIMADINADGDDAEKPDTVFNREDASTDDDLNDDQQAALDKIMAEIKGGAKDDDEPDAPAADGGSDSADDDLDDDQQAALDKIMAEIKGGAKEDDEPDAPAADGGSDSADGDLDDDQQAALDKIMAEIKGGAKDDDEPDAPAADGGSDSADGDLDDDQQAALDKIMPEIKDGAKDAQEPDASVPETPDRGDQKDALTLDEFNDELENLLSAETADTPAPVDHPAEDHRSAEESESEPAVDDPPPDDGGARPKYTMLQEVTPSDADQRSESAAPGKRNRDMAGGRTGARGMRMALMAVALMVAAGTCWGYLRWTSDRVDEAVPAAFDLVPSTSATSHSGPASPATPNSQPAVAPAADENPDPIIAAAESLLSPLASLEADLVQAKASLDAKIDEINELVAYYGDGISAEQEKIGAILQSNPVKSLSGALKNNQIHLAMQAIQRRLVYQAKLDIPLGRLKALSEEIFYLQRKAKLLRILAGGISGLPIEAFREEVTSAIQRQTEQSGNLSIDHIEAAAPTMERIWKELRHQHERDRPQETDAASLTDLDKQISAEICEGNYERMSLLTALHPDTAVCLSQWYGKDLYLNNLNRLTPEAAKALAQWPGEWLSLNGLTAMAPAVARELARWPGRRLSMNGLTQLSAEATAHLSGWQGDQLEMIGLKRIGGWQNYTTRLYLSEALQRELQLR